MRFELKFNSNLILKDFLTVSIRGYAKTIPKMMDAEAIITISANNKANHSNTYNFAQR